MDISPQSLQALLYANGGEMKIKDISALYSSSTEAVLKTADALAHEVDNSGLSLIKTDDTLSLRTHPKYAQEISAMEKNTTDREIGNAGMEVLAIILYRGPTTKTVIDHTRGVNSANTIRTLTLRGLIKKVKSDADARSFVYTITPELLAHLGIESTDDIPEYEKIQTLLNDIYL